MAKKELKPTESSKSDLISRTLGDLGKVIAGIGAEIKEKGVIQKAGQIVQRVRAHGLLQGLSHELDILLKAGEIKPEYFDTSQYMNCLQEILQFLDDDIPDEVRFKALKSIFFVAASEGKSTGNDVLPHQYMRLCKTMSSGAVLVMLTEYKMVNRDRPEGSFPRSVVAVGWRGNIANEAGLGHAEMVGLFEVELIKRNILTALGPTDIKRATITEHGRLTDLGWGLCGFIAHSDNLSPPPSHS